ncbi:MAG: ThiF family adenylyltransferase [Planctomycetales bacterium]|nr:ThiF family adenylyltransferase [Planctomycetales bacterium]
MVQNKSHRYSRQERFSSIGIEGQRHLSASRALLCGCGALGSVIAERLARAGVGYLRIVDRDWVELSNLQRQALFTEAHARESSPKAIAAQQELQKINSDIEIDAVVEDITFANISSLITGCDLVVDGTDNFETRFLINDYCLKFGIPWVHGGCLGASGQVMTIIPGKTACFRCLVPELPPRDALETCDSAGVLGPAVGLIACWQAAEAIKILSGNAASVSQGLIVLDSWNTDCRILGLKRNETCVACGLDQYDFLDGRIRTDATILCGKNAVQVDSPHLQGEALARVAEKLAPLGRVTLNAYFVRIQLGEFMLTVFKGGRTIVEGTTEIAEAKTLIARTLGT